jgi:PAS domain S-box-containing protein
VTTTPARVSEPLAAMARFIVVGGLIAFFCWFSINFTRQPGTGSTIWIASGLLTGVLLTSPRRLWPGYVLVALAGNLLARAAAGDAWYSVLGLGVASTLDALLVSLALAYYVKDVSDPGAIKIVGWVAVLSSIGASAISALLAATVDSAFGVASFWLIFGHWFAAHFLGMVVFATLTAVALQRGWRVFGKPGQRVELLLTTLLVAVVCFGIFSQSRYPLLFLVYPPLLLCAFRHRFDGVVLGMSVVAISAIAATLSGTGPLYHIAGTGVTERAFMLHIFLAVTSLLTLPVAVVLTESSFLGRRLRESERRYRVLADYASDLVVRVDASGRLLYVSPSAKEMLGWELDELAVRPVREIIHVEDLSVLAQTMKQLALVGGTSTATYRALHKDGHYVWIEARARAVPGSEADAAPEVVFACRDVTGRKQAEQALERRNLDLEASNEKLAGAQTQLLQSEKMASVGQLAAGVAHEINNPIGYVRSNLTSLTQYWQKINSVLEAYEQLEAALPAVPPEWNAVHTLKQRVELDYLRQDIVNLLDESVEGVTRVEKIVRDLRDFSHVDQAEWMPADIHDCIDSTLNVVWHELKYKGEVIKHYADLPLVQCLPFQLKQVFMNLLVNAAHAIERQGTITIRTEREHDNVRISFADTGKGIEPACLKRIFEPFFTTKPIGVGTGLGLSVSYGIIQKHGGTINVASDVGKGTTFTIRLPIIQAEA